MNLHGYSNTMTLRRMGLMVVMVVTLPLLAFPAIGGAARLDPSFGTEGLSVLDYPKFASDGAFDLDGGPSGGVVVAGYASFELDRDGQVIPSFGAQGLLSSDTKMTQVERLPDGKLLFGGTRDFGGTSADVVIQRREPDGSPDHSFASDSTVLLPRRHADRRLNGMAISRGGVVYLVGAALRSSGRKEGFVSKISSRGKLVRSFGSGGFASVRARKGTASLTDVAFLGSGKLLVSGVTKNRFLLMRLRADGRLDRSFGRGDGKTVLRLDRRGGAYLARIALARGGDVLMLNGYRYGNSYAGMSRFNADGTLDRGFGRQGFVVPKELIGNDTGTGAVTATDVAVDRTGRAVVSAVGGGDRESRFEVIRFERSGGLDRSFFGDGIGSWRLGEISAARSVLVQPDGRIAAAGVAESKDQSVPVTIAITP